jgi:hypothetical protein
MRDSDRVAGVRQIDVFPQRFAATHDHVSKDLLRNNRKPQRRQEHLIAESLASGRSVVVDNTNPSAAVRAPLIADCEKARRGSLRLLFSHRSRRRASTQPCASGSERVPDVAIFTVRNVWNLRRPAEGFDRLFTVKMNEADRTV